MAKEATYLMATRKQNSQIRGARDKICPSKAHPQWPYFLDSTNNTIRA
jgi:hypothetical protein